MGEGIEVFFTEKFYKIFERIAVALETMPLPEIHEELKAINKNLGEIARRD